MASGSPSSSSVSCSTASRDQSRSPGHTPHRYAQQMNNSAASCIEIGLYDRAAMSLKRALKLSKVGQPARTSLCECHQCSLDWCILRSKAQARRQQQQHQHRITTTTPSEAFDRDDAFDCNGDSDSDCDSDCDSYIYKTPIRVKCQGHSMGPALYLIIAFNLALTNHLIALQHSNSSENTVDTTNPNGHRRPGEYNNSHASKARDLYKLTYEMQANLLDQERQKDPNLMSIPYLVALRSIRFELILLNNTSHVYGMLGEEAKQTDCLGRLQSTMMIVVDHHFQTMGTTESTTETNDDDGIHNSSELDRFWRIELGGFLKNTSHLVLRPVYTCSAA